MAKAIGWIVACAFGFTIGAVVIFAVGETVDTIAAYRANQ
jgi:hypothetical protein